MGRLLTQPHPHVDGQVMSVHLVVQLLSLVKAFEVNGHLGTLLGLVAQLLQVLHKLDALRTRKGRGRRAWSE